MGRVAQIRTIYPLPGKLSDTLTMLREVEPVRRRYGLVEQVIAQKRAPGSDMLTVVFIWEDEEALKRWLSSEDRTRLRSDARRLRVDQPSPLYDIL